MITVYYHKGLKLGIITNDGMPALVLTDECVLEYEHFITRAQKLTRQTGKSDSIRTQFELILRYTDESVGWERL